MADSRRPRLAIVVSHPIQHFCPLYRGIAVDGRLLLKVIFASDAGKSSYFDPAFGRVVDWGADITDGFEHEYLPGFQSYDLAAGRGSRSLASSLQAFDPDVVQFYGYSSRLARQALIWAKRMRRRSIMVGDSELLAPRRISARITKAACLPVIFRLPTAFITIGDENERYYCRYGVRAERLRRSPIPINSPLLDRALADVKSRANTRGRWQVASTDCVLLVVGKSIARKSHDHVLQAVGRMSADRRNRIVVVFAGGGPESDALRKLSMSLGVRTVLAGFLNIPDLMAAYVAADVLVHPSAADPHPLAIAEGVYAGLPVIMSDRIGSWGLTDDVQPGRNGLRFPYGDLATLGKAISRLADSDDVRDRMANESKNIGRARALGESVRSYVEAILDVAGAGGHPPGTVVRLPHER